jgi:hypothetical protein
MGRWIVVASAAVLVLVGLSESATAQPPSGQLDVRIYDNTQLPRRNLAAALVEAGRLVASVGLDVHWRDCSPDAQAPLKSEAPVPRGPSCGDSLATGELALRIVHVPAPSDEERALPLGDSLIDRHLGLGVLATIYYERVEWLARQAGVSTRLVLARAIAHEIAHLLIGSTAHAGSGLMRPLWSRQELQRNRSADWRFTAADADAIRERRNRALGTTLAGD